MTTSTDIYALALAGVQRLIPYKAGKPIEELERELGLSHIIKLASNENPLGPSKKALTAIQHALANLAYYPDGSGFRLKQALAEKHQIDAEQITLGNGSNELLELVARAFLTTEHEVIFSQHAFAVYPLVTQAIGATAVVIPAINYGHDLSAMLDAITHRTRLVFIANPNNPTGTLLAQSEIENFINALPQNVLCVLDEAYFEFVTAEGGINSLDWLKTHNNLIITRTFSKAYGLAGLRIGYSFSSAECADILNRVRQPFNNNSLALVAAEAALTDGEHLQRTIANNRLGLLQLTDGFNQLGLEWITSAANFVAVNCAQAGLPLYEKLLHKGIIVRPIANYEMPHHLRISIGAPEENQLFLHAFSDVLNNV